MTNKVEDVLIVPVNFSYERLLDGNFIREQLGRPKVSESFASAALGLWNSLQAKFGSARIDFGQPFSLRVTTTWILLTITHLKVVIPFLLFYPAFSYAQEYIHAYQVGKLSPLTFPQRAHNNNNNDEDIILKGELAQSLLNTSSTSAICSLEMESVELRELVDNLAKHVIYGELLVPHRNQTSNE